MNTQEVLQAVRDLMLRAPVDLRDLCVLMIWCGGLWGFWWFLTQ